MELISLNLVTTIRIRSDRYYLAEYQIAIWFTIRPRSEYEANIRVSPSIYIETIHRNKKGGIQCFSISTEPIMRNKGSGLYIRPTVYIVGYN